MDIIYLFRVLLKRKWIIIAAGLIAGGLAFYLTRHETKYYRSSSQFSTGFAITENIKMTGSDINMFEAETRFNNVIVTLGTPTVTSLLAYKMMLHDLENPTKIYKTLTPEQKQSPEYLQVNQEEAKKVLKEKLETMTMLSSYNPEEKKLLDFLALHDYDYKSVSKNLTVYRVRGTDYIQIDYISLHPELSAFAVNNIFDQFLRHYGRAQQTESQESIDTLRSIMVKKKEELDAKTQELIKSGIIDAGEQTIATMSTISELELSLSTERSRLTTLEFELKKMDQRIASNTSRTTTKPADTDNAEIILAEKARDEAYRAARDNPSDVALQNRYKEANEELRKKRRNYRSAATDPVSNVRNKDDLQDERADIVIDIQAARSTIGQLQGRINQLQGTVAAVSSKGAAADSKLKEREQANKDYLDAKQKYTDATDFGTSAINNFRQMVPGQPATEPEPSKRKMLVGMAGAASVITTILIIIFLTYLDSSVKTPVIFGKTVGLKLISMVNFMNLKSKSLVDIIANKDHDVNATEKNRHNRFRESLRKLRYEIETSGKKIFLFTSTKKGQGKTTLIQALSYSMSLSKKKILIIDTNFCNNDLTVQLNADPILEKIVPYKADGQALLDQVKVFSKEVEGVGSVYAIGSEGGDYTPSEVLPKDNILHHLKSLTKEFDYIFLEGPPLNDFSDSKELTQYVEGVIAVFSATDAIKQIDKQSINFFKDLNGKFCGSILNMVDLKNVNVA